MTIEYRGEGDDEDLEDEQPLRAGTIELEEDDDFGPEDEDDEDDDEDLEESYGGISDVLDSPWVPVPLSAARSFLKAVPDATIDLVFPEAYAEDRSAKLKDLLTAQATDLFSHHRVADQAAQEFGFEQYDWDAEMQAIRDEKKKYGDILGVADAATAAAVGLGKGAKGIPGVGGMGGGGISIGGPGPGLAFEDDLFNDPKRQDMTGPEQAAFRRQQREAFVHLGRLMRRRLDGINREVVAITRRLSEQGAPAVRLTSAEVLYMVDGGPKRCDRCALWIRSSNRCSIHAADVVVAPDMVCGLYVNGDPMEEGEPQGFVTPQESDLGKGDTACGNCRYGSGAPTCQHPCLDGFAIDNVGGCCNAWTAPGSREARPAPHADQVRRLEEAVAQLRERAAAPPPKVDPPVVNITVPEREVHVEPAKVEVTVEAPGPRTIKAERDEKGLITKLTEQ